DCRCKCAARVCCPTDPCASRRSSWSIGGGRRAGVAEPSTSAWDRYWFGESSLVRLAAFRIVMMAAAFYALHQFRVGVLQHADGLDATWVRRDWNPIYLLELLHLS